MGFWLLVFGNLGNDYQASMAEIVHVDAVRTPTMSLIFLSAEEQVVL